MRTQQSRLINNTPIFPNDSVGDRAYVMNLLRFELSFGVQESVPKVLQ